MSVIAIGNPKGAPEKPPSRLCWPTNWQSTALASPLLTQTQTRSSQSGQINEQRRKADALQGRSRSARA
jgi:hypothetical protein